MLLAFGDYRLDIERRELRCGSEVVSLEPKAFDLLAYLVRHRDRVVSKDDLLQEVWGGRIFSEAALTTRINAVRRALGDDGTAQRLVRIYPQGHPLHRRRHQNSPDPSRWLPDKPSIAVLPFQNMSGDPEQEYFADGMVEEIITALSRIRWLFVIARNSSFTYKGQAVDVKQVGRELGVRYVLEGSVRKGGERVRITAQLIDAADRRASLGRPLRRLDGRRFRASGQGRDQRRRGHRAGVAGRRDAPLRRAADDRSHRLRSLSARACGLLSNNERADSRGSGIARSGDRDRSALRAGTFLGGDLPHAARQSTAGPKSRRHPAARPAILPGRRSRRGRTTRASSPTPPSCWLVSARISVP